MSSKEGTEGWSAPCADCHARVGQPCLTKGGKPHASPYRHRARLRAVAAHRWDLVVRGA
jgi:hypothetical protein